MRVRTIVAMAAGAAFGAGWMYLLDPDHGEQRRREARREAARQVRDGTVRAALDAKRRAEDVALAAVSGFHEARVDTGRSGELHHLDGHRAG